jgi:hypothetical protein
VDGFSAVDGYVTAIPAEVLAENWAIADLSAPNKGQNARLIAICLACWLPPPGGLITRCIRSKNSLKEAQLFFDWWDG